MLLPILLVVANLASAQANKGFVVRADGGKVWLDLTAADGAAPGRGFEVYAEGEELKHPVTGESLGKTSEKLGEGRIVEVAEKYSTGDLSTMKSGAIKPGLRARLAAPAPAPVTTTVPSPDARLAEPGLKAAKTRGATLDYAVVGMAVGDFDGAGKPQVALASDQAIKLYAYPVVDGKALAETGVSGTGARVLGLEAGDLDGDGRAELFAAVYDDGFRRFETRVLKLESGKWLKTAELPFLVRSYQDEKGRRVLASQQIVDDKTFPFGNIYPLVHKDGKYVQGSPALRFKRTEWLYGLTTAQLGEGEPSLLYLTNVHALRVQKSKGWWRTPDTDYGQTPVRVRWHERLLEFHPPLATAYRPDGGFDALYAARNMAALGGLATPFGLFNRSELHRKIWNGLALETAWRAELPGCVQGLAVVEAAPGRPEIVAALRGSAEQSSVWTFDP